jgi:hypothetical protein
MLTSTPLNPDVDPHYLPFLLSATFNPGGGSSLGDDDEPDDDDVELDEDDDEDDEPKKKTKGKKSDDEDDDEDDDENLPSNVKAILRKNRLAARKAKADAKAATAELEKLRGKKSKSTDEDDDDRAEREQEAEARGSKRGLDIAKKASVRGALVGAGLNVGDDRDKALVRAMRLIDLDELEVNDDGTIEGLDDAIDDLKDEFPALFKRRRNGGRISGEDNGGQGSGKPEKLTATQQQARQLQGIN